MISDYIIVCSLLFFVQYTYVYVKSTFVRMNKSGLFRLSSKCDPLCGIAVIVILGRPRKLKTLMHISFYIFSADINSIIHET